MLSNGKYKINILHLFRIEIKKGRVVYINLTVSCSHVPSFFSVTGLVCVCLLSSSAISSFKSNMVSILSSTKPEAKTKIV